MNTGHQHGDAVTNTLGEVSRLLHEASENHHRVFRIVDGADDVWARWYADWLANLSELPTFLDQYGGHHGA
jgi:hypothetical protein